jgi:hypothetical protein
MRPTVFYVFQTLFEFGRNVATELLAHPLQIIFSDYTLEEELEVEEPAHWETPIDGNVDPEVDA